jgi:VIT1/CCC1 family predicted Fe2+/Mn2+ transporter
LTRVTVCGDCHEACTGMHDHCEQDSKAQYGDCNRAVDCHVEAGKTVCASKACRQEGYCSTQQKKCESKCATTPPCETTSPFDAGKTLQLGSRDRHLMGLAGMGGIATLFAGGIAAMLLLVTAILARRALALAALIVSAIATVAGVGFVLASGMKSPVGGTSIGWSALVWIAGGVIAIVACVLVRASAPTSEPPR